MSITLRWRGHTEEESRLIAAYPPQRIKRYELGATSDWDSLPFRTRHALLTSSRYRFLKAGTSK